KENHIAMAGGVAEAVAACRETSPGMPVEIEAETLPQVEQAIAAGAHRILLDNMTTADLAAAVAIRDSAGDSAPSLEASGGVDLDTVAAVARTGVDFVSVGSITHSAPNLDLSLLVR
ncbi:MAG: nicotinate-nucleotide diphosphorylase, partial [Solirubrobacterales bacterium]